MKIWQPQMWTPWADRCPDCNRRKRRRRFNPLRMAAGDMMLDVDGKMMLDVDGNMMLDDGAGNGCCCCPCTNCSDGPPPTRTVTLNSIALDDPFLYGSSVGLTGMSATLSGTFTVSRYNIGSGLTRCCGWFAVISPPPSAFSGATAYSDRDSGVAIRSMTISMNQGFGLPSGCTPPGAFDLYTMITLETERISTSGGTASASFLLYISGVATSTCTAYVGTGISNVGTAYGFHGCGHWAGINGTMDTSAP